MKTIILLAALVTLFLTLAAITTSSLMQTSEFLKGWEAGHCEGWKDVKGDLAVCPVTPTAPVADVGKNTYKGGYNKGFKRGTSDAKK